MSTIKVAMAILGLAACGEPAQVEQQDKAEEAPTIIAGPPGGIARVEKVARKCGLANLERRRKSEQLEWLVIKGVPADAPDEHPIYCALVWVYDHPEADLYLVGSAAPE